MSNMLSGIILPINVGQTGTLFGRIKVVNGHNKPVEFTRKPIGESGFRSGIQLQPESELTYKYGVRIAAMLQLTAKGLAKSSQNISSLYISDASDRKPQESCDEIYI